MLWSTVREENIYLASGKDKGQTNLPSALSFYILFISFKNLSLGKLKETRDESLISFKKS